MSKMSKYFWLILIFIAVSVPTLASAAPKENFEKIVLKNGITLMYKVMKNEPRVSMYAVFPIGTNIEKSKGIAHLLEHLVFRGGSGYTFEDIINVTSRQGGFFNGFTSFYTTSYNYVVPKENLTEAFKVFNGCIWGTQLEPSIIEMEKEIITHELDMNYATRYAYYPVIKYFYPEMYHSKETMATISVNDLKDFHQSYYQPRNATYIMAGDFDPKQIISQLETEKNQIGYQETPKIPVKELQLPKGEQVESRNLYPYSYQIMMGYEFSDLSEKERMVLKLISYIFGGDYKIDYLENSYKIYNTLTRSVGKKDYFGIYYLERSKPFTPENYQKEKENILKILHQYQKADFKKELKNFIREVELENVVSQTSVEGAVEYEVQRLTDPDNITIDSLNILKSLKEKDFVAVINKCFSQPPATWVLVKSTKTGGN